MSFRLNRELVERLRERAASRNIVSSDKELMLEAADAIEELITSIEVDRYED